MQVMPWRRWPTSFPGNDVSSRIGIEGDSSLRFFAKHPLAISRITAYITVRRNMPLRGNEKEG